MQETHYKDGHATREFYSGTPSDVAARTAAAIEDEGVASVRQVKIGRNDVCPCGSGRKFKKCCIGKVGAGPMPARLGRPL